LTRAIQALAGALAVFLAVAAEGAEPTPLPGDAKPAARSAEPIRVTINPEGRVSVVFLGPLPPPTVRGTPLALAVRIVNLGFITGRLEARLVGAPVGSELEFAPEPLNGTPGEVRTLRLTLKNPGTTDLTIAFRIRNESPDLGGRDRIHLLIQCR
jgi:hypothetical protein